MSNHTDNKKKLFIAAYIKHKANISKACKEVGISRGAYYKWEKNDEEFLDELWEAWEAKVDSVEDKLDMLIEGFTVTTKEEKVTYKGDVLSTKKETYYPPNMQAIKTFLEAKARHRGYGRKQSEDKGESGEEEVRFTDED